MWEGRESRHKKNRFWRERGRRRAPKKRQPTENRYAPTTTTLHQFFEMPVALFSLKNTRRTVFRKAAGGDGCLIFLFLLSLHCAIALLSTGDELKPIRGFFLTLKDVGVFGIWSKQNTLKIGHTLWEKVVPFLVASGIRGWAGPEKNFFVRNFGVKTGRAVEIQGKKELSERATPHLPDFFLSFSKVAFLPLFTRKTKIEPRPAPKAGRRRGGKVTKSPIFFAGLGYACVIHAS